MCEDESVIGVPFYVMRFLEGHVITQRAAAGPGSEDARYALGMDLVDTLVEIHAALTARSSRHSRGPAATSSAR